MDETQKSQRKLYFGLKNNKNKMHQSSLTKTKVVL